jgi:hypothetical protein
MNVYQQAVPPDAFTPYPSRPITGLCLHHTAGTGLPAPQKGASWHRIIDRAGNIWLAVDPRHAAHCIAIRTAGVRHGCFPHPMGERPTRTTAR